VAVLIDTNATYAANQQALSSPAVPGR